MTSHLRIAAQSVASQPYGKTGDVGLPEVTVSLVDEMGKVIATTVTGTDGLYKFDKLPAGDYTVKVSDVPTGSGSRRSGKVFVITHLIDFRDVWFT